MNCVRLSVFLLCIGLAGCSTALDAPLDDGEPPVISAVVSDIKKTAAEAKLDNPLAVAGPIHANPISSVPWIICLRSQAPGPSPSRTYALFFKDSKLVSYRMTAIVDHCESQTFAPL
jgi:hypothetical protein